MDFNILLLILALAAAGDASTEPSECKEVVCPQLAHIECPEDSYPSLLEPPHYISHPEAQRVLAKRSLVQYHKRESIKIVPGHIHRRSIPELYEPPTEHNATDALFRLCCPQKVCLCHSQCPEPICIGDLVPLVKNQGSHRPGDCCPAYRCAPPPNCTALESGFEWREHCKWCRCEGGVRVCHEEECVSATATSAGRALSCYSRRLGRHFPAGGRWMDDECTHCECSVEGESICQMSVCRTLMCAKQVKLAGECCPRCDIRNTHFCEGHEHCSMVCKHGYQRDNSTDCDLCRCHQGVEALHPGSAAPSATTATPEEDPNGSQTVIIIVACCIIALLLMAGIVWWFCWRPEKTYKTVSTVDSRQSSEGSKGVMSGKPFNCDILSIKMDVDGDTTKKTLREQNGALTNQHNYS
ncbi:kielin/chordin-like protein [Phlebotomus argentipes]|uniref:kielin/chordin-like protein n=1 Tax=Phlebotomus argentipes TaxID=94469 RepID=UPI002892F799|nr:kielin/chordin-like protein [Phlebotomus argentipes]